MLARRVNYAKYVKQVHLPSKSMKKEREMQSLISTLKHPVKQAVKFQPGTRVPFENQFFTKRSSKSAGNVREKPASKLPLINESQTGSFGDQEISTKKQVASTEGGLFKSASYKSLRKDYI